MKAAFIVKHGTAEKAFEIRETEKPSVSEGEVGIKVEVFGLNYADVMARLGLYPDAPPLPSLVGYEVVGKITELGAGVDHLALGDRVVAMTRFGGYAEFAITDARAAAKIPEDMDAGEAAALATQYGTAYFAAEEMVRLHEGDKVLIHAAAGGVGTALTQIAKHRGCEIFGTAGSDEKLDYLKNQGVHHPINYRKDDFETVIKEIVGDEGLDVVFDSVGGDYFKKGMRLLGSGGRFVGYGAARMTDAKNFFQKAKVGLGFGFMSPISTISTSKAVIGVNMLRIADNRPLVIQRCLNAVVDWTDKGILKPVVGGRFSLEQIGEAHAFLQSRKSMGKIVIELK